MKSPTTTAFVEYLDAIGNHPDQIADAGKETAGVETHEGNLQKVQIAIPTTPALAEHVEAAKAAAAPVAPPSYNDKAALIYKFWLAAGFTPAQAAGLLAQADAESSLNEKAVGDHGQAFGLDQWHTARVDAIRNGCGVDLKTLPPLADQLKAAAWELQHTEKHALSCIKASRTAYDAGYAACRFWERPGSTAQYAKRGDRAEWWAAYFAKHPVA